MTGKLKHGNEFANQQKDERLADRVVNRLLWFIFGVLVGVVMVKLF